MLLHTKTLKRETIQKKEKFSIILESIVFKKNSRDFSFLRDHLERPTDESSIYFQNTKIWDIVEKHGKNFEKRDKAIFTHFFIRKLKNERSFSTMATLLLTSRLCEICF